MGLQPLLVQFATWRFVKEKSGSRVSYLLPQGVPRFVFCYPSTPLKAVVSQISDFLTVEYRCNISLMQNRMKAATAALLVKRLQAKSQSVSHTTSQSVPHTTSQSVPHTTSQTTSQTTKRGREEPAEAAKRVEVAKGVAATATTTPSSPLKIRVKVKAERPAGKSLINEVLEAPRWREPDRRSEFPR